MRRIGAVALVTASLVWTMMVPLPSRANEDRADRPKTATPINYLVVIFDENNSFDHYFGAIPYARNPPAEPQFHPSPDTPVVHGFTQVLLTHNPNTANPFRLDRFQALTCDNDNHYTDEQKAYDGGLLDKFAITSATVRGVRRNRDADDRRLFLDPATGEKVGW